MRQVSKYSMGATPTAPLKRSKKVERDSAPLLPVQQPSTRV